MSNTEQIVLTFPGKADYVSLARLTTSGVASRCGFDMDAIEDLKVCVSEILNKIIALGGDADGGMIRLAFSSTASALTILLGAPQITGASLFGSEEDALALSILHSLMDEVSLSGIGDEAVRLVKAFGEDDI
jgi:serine/threonine-protein kinase RsbW